MLMRNKTKTCVFIDKKKESVLRISFYKERWLNVKHECVVRENTDAAQMRDKAIKLSLFKAQILKFK
jgi:hypothetical protein